MSDELPQGWASASFMDVFDIQGGTQPPKSTFKYEPTDGHVRLLQIRDFGEKPVPTFIPSKPTLKTCRKYDILIGRYGASVGRICTGMEGAYNVALTKVVIPEQLDRRFIFHLLRSPFFQRPILDIERSAQDGFNKEDLAEIILPLAPVAEQRRMVRKLEELLGKVDTCQQRLAKIPVLLKRFRQAVLVAACSGRLTADWREENPNIEPAERLGNGEPPAEFDLPSTWNWLLSSHAFGFVTSGSRGWARYYSDKGPLFLRVGNLNHDSITLDLRSIQRVSPPSSAEGRRTKVIEGDILISITADVGMIALIEAGLEEAYINQHVALGRPVGKMDQRYLAYFLAAKNGGQEQFVNLQRGATKVGLGLGDIRSIWLARPPLPEQQEIVRRVESLFALADEIEARFEKARAQVEKLTPSLLARAFHGELVPQDPNDEPASALLERIREKRAGPVPKKSNAKRALVRV